MNLENYFAPPKDGADIRRNITYDCIKLGAMLITYRLLTTIFTYGFYIGAYYRFTGKLAGLNAAIKGLREDYKETVTSTAFSMILNSTVTGTGLICTLLLGWLVLGFGFDGFLRPTKDGAKKGLYFFPACFIMNMVVSLAVNFFTSAMESAGVTIPEADFTIKTPSTAAVVFQFLYVCIAAPLVEEIVFRGMILGALTKYGEIPAIFISALCFGLMHGNIPQAAAAFVVGLAYASLAVSSRSIVPSFIVHMLNNMVVSMAELGNGLELPYVDEVTSIVQVIVAVIGIYIAFTKYSYFRNDSREALPARGAVLKTEMTNPVLLIYLAMLVLNIVEGLINVNS
ncbi:CPBP family intramembrane glutamic endopeptidase [Ruminococcus sp.]|uniref:CPBP family intramembrane glutamic endopeptidase n=1 Tax=Ruminococcus sp. TaxID=41978 RepID=UPI0025F6A08D|nr:CPBP family intramembrane glutamic endopeptidase [Ruminococcus sp.]MBQ8966893.1 CPBP family intramembrane metalloprotease [Ruminococcus sp.]